MEAWLIQSLEQAQSGDDISRTIVSAARDEFVRFGIRRANVEEIARRAGVSRVTVYRRFDNKTGLVAAVVMADVLEFVARFDAELFAEGDIADRLVRATVLSVKELRRHPLLTTVLQSDADTLLSALTLKGEAQFELIKGVLSSRIAHLIEQGEIGQVDPTRTGEVILRLIYSVIVFPFGELPGKTDDEIASFAREYVVPLLVVGRTADDL